MNKILPFYKDEFLSHDLNDESQSSYCRKLFYLFLHSNE